MPRSLSGQSREHKCSPYELFKGFAQQPSREFPTEQPLPGRQSREHKCSPYELREAS